MPRIDPKYRPFVGWLVWPILLLIQLGARSGFRDFLKTSFWLDLGVNLMLGLAVASAGAGVFYAYVLFCRWFNRSIEAERARISARINSRGGGVSRPATHPLHDPEMDD